MTQPNPGGTTPPSVAAPATERAVVPANAPMLIGIFGPENGLSAMIRMPGGRIHEVQAGQKLKGRQVLAIDAGGVILRKGNDEERLSMP